MDTVVNEEHYMCIRLWLEVGHRCKARTSSSLGRAITLDWRVWVKSASDHDISPFVHKVVFYLHPASAFVYPKRVLQAPPYEIQESGCTSIDIPIHIYIKQGLNNLKKIKLKYTINLDNYEKRPTDSNCVYYDFENPSDELKKKLLMGGGEVIANTGVFVPPESKVMLVVTNKDKKHQHKHKHKSSKANSYKFVEPITWKNDLKENQKKMPPKESNANVDFKQLFKDTSMTGSEIDVVSTLYLAYSHYEKQPNPIILPPATDPIYQIPELPKSLKSLLSRIESDYNM